MRGEIGEKDFLTTFTSDVGADRQLRTLRSLQRLQEEQERAAKEATAEAERAAGKAAFTPRAANGLWGLAGRLACRARPFGALWASPKYIQQINPSTLGNQQKETALLVVATDLK
jgi:hypothetical protein